MTLSQLEAEIYRQWDFSDPAASRLVFQRRAETSSDRLTAGIWRTQEARALGLLDEFDAAERLLARVEEKLSALPEGAERDHLLARLSIERGRVLNSNRNPASAREHFEAAFEHAQRAGTEGLAVDALHMRAIVEGSLGGPEMSRPWSERALAMAEASGDPDARRWRGSLLNNLGWDHLDAGEAIAALALFEEALIERSRTGDAELIRVAEAAVAQARDLLGPEPTPG
ncbi:MAG: tetratricopeptide repeat protein [Acidimicrobiia bacterium]